VEFLCASSLVRGQVSPPPLGIALKKLQSIQKQYIFRLLIIVNIVLIRLCCLAVKVRFQYFYKIIFKPEPWFLDFSKPGFWGAKFDEKFRVSVGKNPGQKRLRLNLFSVISEKKSSKEQVLYLNLTTFDFSYIQ